MKNGGFSRLLFKWGRRPAALGHSTDPIEVFRWGDITHISLIGHWYMYVYIYI